MTIDAAYLTSQVYALTNRPDLVAETELAVITSIMKLHMMEFFPQDQVTVLLAWPDADYMQSFSTGDIPRFRKVASLRLWDPSGLDVRTLLPTGRAGTILTAIDSDDILDSYARERKNVFYQAGAQVNIQALVIFSQALLTYYQRPNNTLASHNCSADWLVQEWPGAVILDATALLFKTIGYDEQSVKYTQLVGEQLVLMRQMALPTAGY